MADYHLLRDFIDYNILREFLESAVCHYEHTAPTVSRYLDDLFVRADEAPERVTLQELFQVQQLLSWGQWEHPNYAANRIYKLEQAMGRDTTGQAGF